MAHIIIPSRRVLTSQPQDKQELSGWVDRTRSIIFCASMGEINIASGRALNKVGTGHTTAPVSTGIAFDGSAATGRYEVPLSSGDGIQGARRYILFAEYELTFTSSAVYGPHVIELSAGYGKQVSIGASNGYTQSRRVGCICRPNNQLQTYTRAIDVSYNTDIVRSALFVETGKRPVFAAFGAGWCDVVELTNPVTNAADVFDMLTISGTSYNGTNVNYARKVTVAGVLAQPGLTAHDAIRLAENPWQIFRPRTRRILVAQGGGSTLNASASGGSVASGSANLAAQIALAAVGVSVAGGSANAGASVPLSAAGIATATGSATPTATITLNAAGLAQAAGSAGLSASVLLAGAGAAQAAGNATLAAQLNALAAGAAQAGGSANLSGGAPGELNASGQAQASGSAVLSVTIGLQAAGSAQASGNASGSASAPGQVSATGGAAAGGAATWSVTASITAAGFVQAMGAGSWSVTVPLSAFAGSSASGTATLADIGNVVFVRAPSGSGPSIILPGTYRPAQMKTSRPGNASGHRR